MHILQFGALKLSSYHLWNVYLSQLYKSTHCPKKTLYRKNTGKYAQRSFLAYELSTHSNFPLRYLLHISFFLLHSADRFHIET